MAKPEVVHSLGPGNTKAPLYSNRNQSAFAKHIRETDHKHISALFIRNQTNLQGK